MPLRKLYTTIAAVLFLGIINAQVSAEFTVNNTTGCGSLQAQFTDESTSSAGSIVSWEWSGDLNSSQQNPSRIFGTPGTYSICLTVTDDAGNSDQVCKDDLITVFQLPIPDFTSQEPQGCVPLQVVFEDASQATDAPLVSWTWGLGGSAGIVNNTTPADVSSTYSLSDNYAVNLTVEDENGCTNTVTKTDFVSVTPAPVADVSGTNLQGCVAPHVASFMNNDPNPNVQISWDFGNNITFQGDNPPAVTYNEPGYYTVTAIATNISSQCSDTLVLENYVQVGSEAIFTSSVDGGCEDLTVTFTDTSPEPGTDIVWDFGDGNTSTDANPTHTYAIPGCYTVQLSRTAEGCPSVAYSTNCIQVDPQPDVWYANDNNIGCTLPHIVNFSGISSSATEWSWDFGDGNTSTEQNPTHTFTSFGQYPVTLTVTNEYGCTNEVTVNTINLTELEAVLDVAEISGCAPLEVDLMENSTSVTDIISWEWTVESGSSAYTSTDAAPSFSIADTGVYDVVLIVTNTLGCKDTASFEEVIEVGTPPEINFTVDPVETCIEWDVYFTDESSPNIEEWFWDFGNGENSGEQNPVITYLDTGFYDISLVGIHNGCANTLTLDDHVHIMAPVANFGVINFCEEPYKRKFTNSSIDADFVEWDFGVDGITTDVSTDFNPTYIYDATGTYTVTMRVYNSETQCAHTKTRQIQITDPGASFVVNALEGCKPLTVDLTENSQDAVAWEWSAPGATITNPNAQNPEIIYTSSGIFSDIQLIITDVNECKDTILYTEEIFVGEASSSFTQNITGGCLPLTVDFQQTGTSMFGDVVSWEWKFGNGLGTSTEENPSFTFTEAGLHNVRLKVTDSWGCVKVTNVVGAVEVTDPEAAFTADSLGCTWAAINFTNNSTGVQLDYLWDFGDGNTSTEEAPMHIYQTQGIYNVCLTVTDKYDCVSTICHDNIVNIANPVAIFTVDSTFASCPPLPVNFFNNSINASSYTWDLGDNSGLSTLDSPQHIYTIPGVYNVTLRAYRTEVCQDSVTNQDLIVLEGPEGEYQMDIDTACSPAIVTFNATSVDNYMYIWDFGTGVLDTTQLSATSDEVTFTFTEPGTYYPTLSFLNNTGCFRTLPQIGPMVVASSSPAFEASEEVMCVAGETVTFYNLSSSATPIVGVEWIFEGGSPATSTNFEPNVVFDEPGSYDVTMIIDNGGCTDTLIVPDYIKIGHTPQADFIMSSSTGCTPLTVNFTDFSTVAESNIVSWEWDFGDGGTADIPNPTHIFYHENGSSFTVTLTVTSADGCTDTVSKNVNLLAVSDVNAGEDVTVCIGEPTQLEGVIFGDTTGLTFYWTPLESLSCADCMNPIATPEDTTIYTFIVQTPEGCTSTSEVTVMVKPFPVPVVELTTDTSVCLNDIVQLHVSGGDEVFSYNWDQNVEGLSCYEDCLNPVAQPSETSTYTVTVTTVHGCSSAESVVVDVVDQFQSFAGPDRTVCADDTVQLATTLGTNPFWIVNNDLSCAYCPDPFATPEETTDYVVQVTTDEGCEIIDTVTIYTVSQEDISAGETQKICNGELVSLNASGEGNFSWTPANLMDDANIPDPVATIQETTTFTVEVENGECILEDTVTIEVRDKIEIITEDLLICEGDSIALSVSGGATDFQWIKDEDMVFSDTENPIVFPTETTTYMVIGSLGTCISDTAFITVEVDPAPEIGLQRVYSYFPGDPVEIDIDAHGEEQNYYGYEWTSEGELSCRTCSSLTIDEPVSGTIYNLEVINGNTGCTQSFQTEVRQLNRCPEELIQVPTAFSPNGDGLNDYMEVWLNPVLPHITSIRVYDRWGAQVYEGSSAGQTWDGTANGKVLPPGVYIYMIEAPCPILNNTLVKSGDITILR